MKNTLRMTAVLSVILHGVLLFCGNIVYNHGCESALVSGNIPLWTEELGTAWSQRTTNPVAYEGGAYFFAGTDALDKLTQTIDIREYAPEIDAGIQEFLFTGMVKSYDQVPVDQTKIEVEYWDNAQTTKLDFFDSGFKDNTADWELVSDQRYAPVGTRYIKIRLTSVRNSGTNNDGYFDDLHFDAIPRPEIVPMELPLSFALVTNDLGIYSFNNLSPASTDLDGDGLIDLIIGAHGGFLIHYEQSTINSSTFVYRTDYFNSIALATGHSTPYFTDLDGDGLIDLMVGAGNGTISYYEQNSVNSLLFTLLTETFNSIDIGSYAAPAFTDIDGNGLIDMLIGTVGYIEHYEQSALNSTSLTLRTATFNSINLPSNSTPAFTDLEGDGLIDLLIGDMDGYIRHYEQNAINSTGFSAITYNFNSIDVGDNAAPAFTDIDGDGLLDMLVGDYDGKIENYEQKSAGPYDFGSVKTGEFSQLSYFLRANYLKADLSINCPEGFKASLTSGSGYVQNLIVNPVNNRISRTIYIHFEPDTLGVISGNIVHSSQEAILKNVAVSGIGLPGKPLNITTEIAGTDLIISWDAVTGATSYKIYSSADPYGTFAETATSGTNSWTTAYTEPKKFYYVVAVDGSKTAGKTINVKNETADR